MATLKGVALKGDVMNIKEEILTQMDSSLRPEFDKAIDNTIERAFKEDVKTLGFMVANSIKCQWEVMKPHLFYSYCLGVKAQEAKAQAVPEWISVEDQMPPVDETVLVCWDYAPDIEPDKEYTTIDENLDEYWPNCQDEPPTHWMPLPEVIKAQEPAND